MNIKFSIIIPTYNRASFIAKTIDSVLNQLYKNFEVIVVDDGSEDNTVDVVKQYSDERVKYFRIKNSERGAARNFGANQAQGEYLNFLDSDDFLYEEHLLTAFKVINDFNYSVFSLHYDLLVNGNYKSANYCPKKNLINKELVNKGNFLSCNAVFLSKKIFENTFFNEDRKLSGSEDYELWLRIAARYPFGYYPVISSTIVYHDDRSVVTMASEKLIQRKNLMLNYLYKDEKFLSKYGQYRSVLESNSLSYVSLHLTLNGQRKKAIKYFVKSLLKRPISILSRRSLAIIKRLVF